MPDYKIYSLDAKLFGNAAIAFSACYRNGANYPRIETFLLIPDEKHTLIANKLRFDVTSFDNSLTELNDAFMLEVGLEQIKIDLTGYINSLATDKDRIPFVDYSSNLIESSPQSLAQLWIRGFYPNLTDVYHKSEYGQLREFISQIVKLPQIIKDKI